MSEISPNQWTILEALQEGPRWARSFQSVKPLYEDLIARDLIERCRPHLGRAKNKLRLTLRGCALLSVDSERAQTERLSDGRPTEPLHSTKQWSLRAPWEHANEIARRTYEAVKRTIDAGGTIPDAVGALAEAEGVQRPAIWRRLRAGGCITPLRTGVRKLKRRIAATPLAENDDAPVFVDRDPCPRCGIRADIGCKHSRAVLGTAF